MFISDFFPRQAQLGDIITVMGSGFLTSPTPPTHADVGCLPSTPVRVLSDTELEFDVKPHFFTNRIWLRHINANQGVLNMANGPDRLEIIGTPSGPPAAPDQVQTYPVSGTTLDVRWRDNAVDEQLYELAIDIGASGWTTYRLGADTEHYRVTNLLPGRAYRVQVIAWNQQGKASSRLVTSDVLPNVGPLMGEIMVANASPDSTLKSGTYLLKGYLMDALYDTNRTGVVELRQTNLQGMPDPDTLLFPFESLVTPTNPPWTGFAGQAYEVDAEAIVSGYPDTSSANPSPQFVALHIGPDGQGGYEVKRMLAGDLWDCVAPTQSGCELKGKVMMNYTPVALDYSIPERGRMAGTATGTVEFRLSPVWDSADIIFTFDVYFINDKP